MATSASQAFCLKLNSHHSHMIQAFQRMYNDEVMVDCTLSCSGGTLKAHKLILSACSPYFTNLFASFTNPYQYPVVILKDMPFADLKAIIEFMYRGEVTVSQSILSSVLESAKALSVTGLCDIKIAAPQDMFSPKTKKRRRRNSRESASMAVSDLSDEEDSQKDIPRSEHVTLEEIEDPNGIISNLDTFDHDKQDIREIDKQDIEHETSSFQSSSRVSLQPKIGASKGPLVTPSVAYKQGLREERSQRMSLEAGMPLCGRKIWSDVETAALLKVWQEENDRVWASAGKKTLSLPTLVELLQKEGVTRDLSQVEGKIKAFKRDFKAVKAGTATSGTQEKMALIWDKLEAIFASEETLSH